MELFELTAHELRDMLRKKEISAVELTKSVLARIENVESRIKSYITIMPETAIEMAETAQKRIDAGDTDSDLLGIPVAPKDNMCTAGIKTTCASRILENYIPPYDATVVRKLKHAGAVFPGKTNLDEFAMGSSTENSGFFNSHNPWNTEYVPGGSSGGAATSVAAGEAILSLGSDTGGSIRMPASFCGVTGLKPTYGRVSRYGLVAFASSLDQIGPLAKDVEDCAILLKTISGWDENDSTSVNMDVPDFVKALTGGVKGLRIGVIKELMGEGIDPDIQTAVRNAVKVLESAGAVADEAPMPMLEYGLPTYYILAPAEASSNLARYDGVRYGSRKLGDNHVGMVEKTRGDGFGDEVKQRIMIGTYALSAGYYDAYYLKAQQVRTLIRREFDKAFSQFDILVSPVAPTVAFKIGEKANDPLAMKLSDICTIPVNLAGLPAMSIPCGFKDGLPIGMHIISKPWDEATLLNAGYAYEQRSDWRLKRPML